MGVILNGFTTFSQGLLGDRDQPCCRLKDEIPLVTHMLTKDIRCPSCYNFSAWYQKKKRLVDRRSVYTALSGCTLIKLHITQFFFAELLSPADGKIGWRRWARRWSLCNPPLFFSPRSIFGLLVTISHCSLKILPCNWPFPSEMGDMTFLGLTLVVAWD